MMAVTALLEYLDLAQVKAGNHNLHIETVEYRKNIPDQMVLSLVG